MRLKNTILQRLMESWIDSIKKGSSWNVDHEHAKNFRDILHKHGYGLHYISKIDDSGIETTSHCYKRKDDWGDEHEVYVGHDKHSNPIAWTSYNGVSSTAENGTTAAELDDHLKEKKF